MPRHEYQTPTKTHQSAEERFGAPDQTSDAAYDQISPELGEDVTRLLLSIDETLALGELATAE